MVLWEITLGTAYFLGLKRTYRLALKIQRRLISPKHPKIRRFVHGRTRAAFDVALKVHKNVQERDIEVGRSLGNRILRCLDRMKPSAQIRGPPTSSSGNANANMTKQFTKSSGQKIPGGFQRYSSPVGNNREADRQLFSSSRGIWPKSFPTIAMMMRPADPAGTNTQYRRLSFSSLEAFRSSSNNRNGAAEGVIRKDIMQWMMLPN
ncbi:uncharacterized protein LOC127786636 isoform X5 [Diospyros lotus]|uniref:uncharacterized protein LOC127786636 isoform X3 n=1 Tax=Diospyros lotus TaxID=55363 RepID=UPI002256E8E3|nr:uncharacterized protein LOC127786636 isoform X3 [Diospyros lotus]XP_052170124.1 uncharacterized protein LOC127786636 isoform X4 [Diospyros lotus]XP_052170125.1 uncharacterized protein LOC127786636 isoform X5 [Diospyros lotus]